MKPVDIFHDLSYTEWVTPVQFNFTKTHILYLCLPLFFSNFVYSKADHVVLPRDQKFETSKGNYRAIIPTDLRMINACVHFLFKWFGLMKFIQNFIHGMKVFYYSQLSLQYDCRLNKIISEELQQQHEWTTGMLFHGR